ncbi:hypothetical protein AVEN_219315-1 [Araneus ventricosus]|uniref:Uncharacterized protein n=1 Tax=Araneus ventricosus TaxID=182803 RepID=A0A4Y2BFX7_ARAVE|nr:hypothetical protein AVEN_219315-1 [Araneus ventricosus]
MRSDPRRQNWLAPVPRTWRNRIWNPIYSDLEARTLASGHHGAVFHWCKPYLLNLWVVGLAAPMNHKPILSIFSSNEDSVMKLTLPNRALLGHTTAAPDIRSPCCISCWTLKNDHAPYYAPQPSHVSIQDPDAPTLSVNAIDARYDFANAMLQLVDEGDIDVGNKWFSDEAYFNLDGFVNKQNWRIWGTENPHVAVPSSL